MNKEVEDKEQEEFIKICMQAGLTGEEIKAQLLKREWFFDKLKSLQPVEDKNNLGEEEKLAEKEYPDRTSDDPKWVDQWNRNNRKKWIAGYKAALQSGLSINFAEEKEEQQNAEKGKVILKIKANESKVDMEKFGDLEKEFGENLE